MLAAAIVCTPDLAKRSTRPGRDGQATLKPSLRSGRTHPDPGAIPGGGWRERERTGFWRELNHSDLQTPQKVQCVLMFTPPV